LLKADLHIHTRYSMDCQTPLEKIIERCQELGINCIAIADHGTADGALEMQKIAPFEVIIAEEIMTTEGEIMGMFLKETIKSESNSRITPQEAVKRIREQGGLVNIPHPFETMRGSALKDKVIEEIAADIDLMEVLNSRSLRRSTAFPGAPAAMPIRSTKSVMPISK
jgi:predicted metal-dependent phosphoesterase TrpH